MLDSQETRGLSDFTLYQIRRQSDANGLHRYTEREKEEVGYKLDTIGTGVETFPKMAAIHFAPGGGLDRSNTVRHPLSKWNPRDYVRLFLVLSKTDNLTFHGVIRLLCRCSQTVQDLRFFFYILPRLFCLFQPFYDRLAVPYSVSVQNGTYDTLSV